MGNKNRSKNKNEDVVVNENEVVDNDKHVVSKELEETVLEAGGEVMRVNPVEENNEEEVNENEVENNDEEVNENPEVVNAVVVNCNKLNVRKQPSKDAEVLCIINKDTELTVNTNESTEDFYKVYTSSNEVLYEGYCVKSFINIK